MACDSPLSIRYNPPLDDGTGRLIYYFPADCGKCLKCLIKRKAQWSYRLTEEKRESFSAYFVTLTYNEKNLPWADGKATINKNDHYEFIRNLRLLENPKRLGKRLAISTEEYLRATRNIKEEGDLKYYGCYEYGDQFGRPHGHYILFNVRDIDNIRIAWSNSVLVKEGRKKVRVFTDQKGIVEIDPDVNVNNIDYVLKYMIKENYKDDQEQQRELSFMSKGLGLCVADPAFRKSIQRTDVNQVVNQRGSKIPLPRYYRKKFVSRDKQQEKNQYIAQQMELEAARKDAGYLVKKQNPDLMEKGAKDARRDILQKRAKRLLE